LTLGGHFLRHIVEGLLRRLIFNPRVASLAVVEDLDVLKDCNLGLNARFETLTMHPYARGKCLK